MQTNRNCYQETMVFGNHLVNFNEEQNEKPDPETPRLEWVQNFCKNERSFAFYRLTLNRLWPLIFAKSYI